MGFGQANCDIFSSNVILDSRSLTLLSIGALGFWYVGVSFGAETADAVNTKQQIKQYLIKT